MIDIYFMTGPIHVHKLLGAVSEKASTLDELKEKFGKDANFVNCKDMKFTFDNVIDFLKEKNKIIVDGDLISFNKEMKMCSHN